MRYAERNTAAFTTGSEGRIKIRAFHDRQFGADYGDPHAGCHPGNAASSVLLYRRRSWALYPALVGFALFVIALAVTLIVEVPIDNQIEGWTVASLPANWQQLRDQWELFHVIRTWASVIGLALLILAALLVSDSAAGERPKR